MPAPLRSRILPTLPPFITFPPCFNGEIICSPPFRPTPPPTPTPTASTTPEATPIPSETPAGYVEGLDCRNSAPNFPLSNGYLVCFGLGRIPQSIKAKVKLTSKPSDPTKTCYNIPETETEISLVRRNHCDWASGLFLWESNAFETPLRMYVIADEMIAPDPNLPDNTGVFHFENSNDEDNTGSCSYNQRTGKINFSLAGTSTFAPQGGGPDPCKMSFNVEYEGDGAIIPPPPTCPPTPSPRPPSPTPSGTVTPTPTPTPSKSPTPTPSPSPSPTPTESPTPTPSESPTPTPSESVTPTPTPTPT